MNKTGVGRGVTDILKERGLRFTGVVIHGGESTHHTHEVIDEAAEWCMCVLDDRFAFGPVQL